LKNLNQIEEKQAHNLIMTDYFFLFCIWLVVFWAIDPFDWKLEHIAVVKHFPAVAITPVFILAAVGNVLFRRRSAPFIKSQDNQGLLIITLLFSLFVTVGSLYARFVKGIDNSFLTMGLYAMTAPLTVWFIRRSWNPLSLIKCVLFTYLFWALVAIAMQIVTYGQKEVFHSREHLVIGTLALIYFLAKSNFTRFIALSFIILASIIAKKNTAYLIMLLIMSYVFLVWGLQHGQKIKDNFLRKAFWIRIVLMSVFLASVVVIIYFYVKSSLPTGNPDYRLYTYERAWNKFLDSPIWGTGFTGAGSEKFDLFTVAVSTTQVLPTHSDPLDIMAQGGLIGFLLWVVIFIVLSRQWISLVLHPEWQQNTALPYLHTLYCMMYSGIVVCMFNPILNDPAAAWTFWAVIGMLIVLLKVPLSAAKKVKN
jgi:hypothetical protein